MQLCSRLRHFSGLPYFCHRLWRNWPPLQLCSSLLHKFGRVGVLPIKGKHRLDIPLGEAFHFRQFVEQFTGQPGDDRGSPAFLLLTGRDDAADVPIKLDKFGIDRQYGARLGLLDSVLDLLQKDRKVIREALFLFAHVRLPN